MAEWMVDQIPPVADPHPTTTLTGALAIGATQASFADTSKMPTAGNVARVVLGFGATGEIVAVTGGAGNPYTISPTTYAHADGETANVVITKMALENVVDERADTIVAAHNADTTGPHGITDTADLVTKSGAQTLTGQKTHNQPILLPAGSAAAVAARVGGQQNGLFSPGSGILALGAGGAEVARGTPSQFQVATNRTLTADAANFPFTLRLGSDYVRDDVFGSYLSEDIDATQRAFTIYSDWPMPQGYYPRSALIDDVEYVVLLSAPVDNGDGTYTFGANKVVRGRPIGGGTGSAHATGATFRWTDNLTTMDGFVVSHLAPGDLSFVQASTAGAADPVRIFVPPRATLSGWPAPSGGQIVGVSFKSTYYKTLQIVEPLNMETLAEVSGTGRKAVYLKFSATGIEYMPFGGGSL